MEHSWPAVRALDHVVTHVSDWERSNRFYRDVVGASQGRVSELLDPASKCFNGWMDYGILFLRVVVGSVFFAHGAQKLFGWWGGGGLRGTAEWLGSTGFRPPRLMAAAVALSESSGVLLVLGVATPFVALALAATMVVAVGTTHWKNGFWSGKGGYEFNLVLWAAAIAVAAIGPGRFSVDRLLGLDDNSSGLWWGVGVLAVSLVSGLLILVTRRQPVANEGVGKQ